jgi:hypothetical protein
MDPDWKTSWGLGFSVYQVDGKTLVGHGGSCPGYRSSLVIDPQKRWAFIVMINACGVNPSKYATGMREIIEKALKPEKDKQSKEVDLEDYSGVYDSQPWGSETVVVPWQGKLAAFGLPASSPAKRLTFLKFVKKNVFKRVRKDDRPVLEVVFERDRSGRVIRMHSGHNYKNKLK